DPEPIMDAFVTMPTVKQVIARGETKSSVVVEDFVQGQRVVLNADLRVVTDEQFPFAQHSFTGSKDHNIKRRQRAIDHGLRVTEHELAGDGKRIKCKDEPSLFAALELDWIPPEMREDTGEFELAAWENGKSKHRLPQLIEAGDVRGVFHNHTTASDGASTL